VAEIKGTFLTRLKTIYSSTLKIARLRRLQRHRETWSSQTKSLSDKTVRDYQTRLHPSPSRYQESRSARALASPIVKTQRISTHRRDHQISHSTFTEISIDFWPRLWRSEEFKWLIKSFFELIFKVKKSFIE